MASRPEGDAVGVSTISGDTEWFPYRAHMTIRELKVEVGNRLKLKPDQQRFVYNETILKVYHNPCVLCV